ncbi:MAG: response regulator transcription factor [Alphaproteobacteria bacterium]|nr:response regulator transcription factor [Alphaproteobacteria bacterium]
MLLMNNSTKRITLVDDDENILTSISMILEEEGYNVESFTDGRIALQNILSSPPSLVVLDIKMPRMDGMEILQEIRKTSAIPVIFLTSKDDESDELHGFRIGADDYITKPFSLELLLERIKALLRRIKLDTTTIQPTTEDNSLKMGNLFIDKDHHLCTWKDCEVEFTLTELMIIMKLVENPGHTKSREDLIKAAYGESSFADDRAIDSHIKRIRQKFKKADNSFSNIKTLYGAGYRFTL